MNPLAKQTEVREDGLDNDLAAHINSKMADLALSSAEKQVHKTVQTFSNFNYCESILCIATS